MKIFLTGVTGYIGKRLLIKLLNDGHFVYCSVRDKKLFDREEFKEFTSQLEVIQNDFLVKESTANIPADIDVAYYLIHSMSDKGDFTQSESTAAINFREAIEKTTVKQVIYLTGIVNEENLSKHLHSRKQVESYLQSNHYALTCLRAGIIVGSGSASFEIIRDLVEKIPVLIAPKWLNTKCQPIAIRNVIEFLTGVIGKEFTYNRNFDIAGPEVLTYKQMLLQYAEVRKIKRWVFTFPLMTRRISSYMLYFITSTSYYLAKNLVDSMNVDVVAKQNDLAERLNINPIPYKKAIELAFDKIKQNDVMSSWYDSFSETLYQKNVWNYIKVPSHACFKDERTMKIDDENQSLDKIFGIGGKNGWYHGNSLWALRGFIDRLAGGVGLRRGRRNQKELRAGDPLDFWRVLYANREEKRLLLFAEMKLPGEAWLEFEIKDGILRQTATFRPLGIAGRLYWYSVLPFHGYIFSGMLRKISKIS